MRPVRRGRMSDVAAALELHRPGRIVRTACAYLGGMCVAEEDRRRRRRGVRRECAELGLKSL